MKKLKHVGGVGRKGMALTEILRARRKDGSGHLETQELQSPKESAAAGSKPRFESEWDAAALIEALAAREKTLDSYLQPLQDNAVAKPERAAAPAPARRQIGRRWAHRIATGKCAGRRPRSPWGF